MEIVRKRIDELNPGEVVLSAPLPYFPWHLPHPPFVVGTVIPGGGSKNHTVIWSMESEDVPRQEQMTYKNEYMVSVVVP